MLSQYMKFSSDMRHVISLTNFQLAMIDQSKEPSSTQVLLYCFFLPYYIQLDETQLLVSPSVGNQLLIDLMNERSFARRREKRLLFLLFFLLFFRKF